MKDSSKHVQSRHRRLWRGSTESINDKVLVFILSDMFYYAGIDVTYAYMAVLITAQVTDGNIAAVGFSLTITMLARAISELPFSKITQKYNKTTKRNIVTMSLILYGILLMILGQAQLLWHVYLLQVFIGLLEGLAYPIKWGIFTSILDKGKEEFEWGLEDVASTFFPALFAMLAGVLAGIVGLPALFFLFGLIMIISGVLFLRVYGRR